VRNFHSKVYGFKMLHVFFSNSLQAIAEGNDNALKRSKLHLKQKLVEALHSIVSDVMT